MLNGNGLDGISGILFDCAETLIDIRTDESNIRTYVPISRWLVHDGVKIAPDGLTRTYIRRCKEIERRWVRHYELKVEEIFSKICNQQASRAIDDLTMRIEAARIFRSASMRWLQDFPKNIRMLQVLNDCPLDKVSNGQRLFCELELKALGLHNYFKFIIVSSDSGIKSRMQGFFVAGPQHLRLRSEEILNIGDSYQNDIYPSRDLGMKAMHINEAWRFFNVG